MKSNVFKMATITQALLLTLSGCTDSKMRIENSEFSVGLVTGSESNQVATLTLAELSLASDQAYQQTDVVESLTPAFFNGLNWPLQNESNETSGLRSVRISGQILIIDNTKLPWSSLNNQKNIQSLIVEADTIVVLSEFKVPSAQIKLVADRVILETSGRIDVTPVSPGSLQPAFGRDRSNQVIKNKSGEEIAYDGKDGADGSMIAVYARKMEIRGDANSTRFVARGGNGEWAGQGKGQTLNDFLTAPIYAEKRTPIRDVPGKFRQYKDSVIYSAGHVSGSVVRVIGRGDAMREVHHPTFAKEVGSPRFPAHGADAVAGGLPGAGGAGGVVRLWLGNSNDFSSEIADVRPGEAGRADELRKGTAGGLPNPACKINWSGKYVSLQGVDPDKPSIECQTQKNGMDALGPQEPDHSNADGQMFLETNTQDVSVLSRVYFELKLKQIRDLYISRNYNEAIELVNFTENKARLVKRSSLEFTSILIQLSKIRNSLLNQKDYFGRGLNDVSKYTFNFKSNLFEAEVKRTMRAYYLSQLFLKHSQKNEVQVKALQDSLGLIESSIITSEETLKNSFKILNDINWQSAQIRKTEQLIREELAVIQKQIEELAKSNVEVRKRQAEFMRFLDVATTVCQVIPAGQPALGAIATIASASIKKANSQSLGDYVSWMQKMKGQFDDYNKNVDMEASQKNFKEFKDQFDFSQLSGKSVEEKGKYLFDLYTKLGPTITKVTEAINSLNQPIFPNDEIQKEIERIQSDHSVFGPLFQGIVAKLNDLLKQKAKNQEDMLRFNSMVEQVIVDINNYILVSAKVSSESLKAGVVDDGELAAVFTQISDRSEDNLIRMYSELMSAYQYTTLESEPFVDINLSKLRGKMSFVLSEESVATGVEALTKFYLQGVDRLKSRLSEKIQSYDRVIGTRDGGYVQKTLSHQQIQTLNRNGFVDIELTSKDYGDRDNVRIVKVDLDTEAVRFKDSKLGDSMSTSLYVELAQEGSLSVDNKVHTFIYPLTAGGAPMFRWQYSFKFAANSDRPSVLENEPSVYFEGLLSTVGGVRSPNEMRYLYENHAGVTKIRVRFEDLKFVKPLGALTLKVAYIFSNKR